ncbi:MAG: ABC transporter permease [Patescibacteria group bacterium]|nr:ABC transporter permease [Patescibacteria group bacterium]
MKLEYTFKSALKALLTHKSRSALTILGIVIGITAIMMIMSMGSGAENLILGELGSFGSELIAVMPGREPTGPTDFAEMMFSDSLKERDVEALKKKSNVPGLRDISPEVLVPGSVSYMGETFKPMIIGWNVEMLAELMDLYPEKGNLFDDNDIRTKASVAVIGSKVKEELFGAQDAVNKKIKIKNRNFRVVGVFEKRGIVSFLNVDESVLIPYTTAITYLRGTDYYSQLNIIATSPEVIDETVLDIERTLREMHGITDPEKDDFYVTTQEAMLEQIGTIIGILTMFLSAVVAISLIVGGIGIMNIMLVSVTERTREIGLRKALGATEGNILKQFLIESVMLTATGGAIGIAFGAGLSFLVSVALSKFAGLNWSFSFPLTAAIMGLGVSAFVGLIFGLYPAKKASQKSPIEALRYE